MNPYAPYWLPHTKREVLAWLVKRYPEGRFKGMRKGQLLKIYHSTRRKEG